MATDGFLLGYFSGNREFVLPIESGTEALAILAKRGAGKTYTAGVLEEELARRGFPFVVLDPVGVHWGLRSSVDGKSESPYPVVVAGGEHADVEISRDSGPALADAIVDQNLSVIVDLSRLSKSAWRIFVRDFSRQLFTRNRTPRHLIIEEATEFVPQQRRPEMQECYEAVERCVRLGRNYGLGVTLIAQRSAQIAKDVLYALDCLIVHRTVGTLDVKAIVDLLRDDLEEAQLPDLERFKGEIASLPAGRAWVWDSGRHIFAPVTIRARRTYHAGATPTFDAAELPAALEARPDVSALRALLAPKEDEPDVVKTSGKHARNNSADVRPPQPTACDHDAEIRRLTHERDNLAHTEGQLREDRNRFLVEKQALEKQVESLTSQLEAGLQLQAAFARFIGPALSGVPIAEVAASGIDFDAIAGEVAKRIGRANGHAPAVTIAAPEALRKKFLQEAAERLYGRLTKLSADALTAMEFLIGQGEPVSTSHLAKAISGYATGPSIKRWAAALGMLGTAGVVKKSGGENKSATMFSSNIRGCVEDALREHKPTGDEIAAVEQQVLYRLATKQEVPA